MEEVAAVVREPGCCSVERHAAITNNPIAWRLYAEPLPGYTEAQPAVFGDEVEKLILKNCRRCHSTLAVAVDAREAA